MTVSKLLEVTQEFDLKFTKKLLLIVLQAFPRLKIDLTLYQALDREESTRSSLLIFGCQKAL